MNWVLGSAEVITTFSVFGSVHVPITCWPTAGPVTVTVGLEEYPDPPAVTVKPVTTPAVMAAVAVAPVPVLSVIWTVGRWHSCSRRSPPRLW